MRLLRRAIRIVRRNSPWQIVQTALAVIEDQAFEWQYGVDTSGTTQLRDLAIDSRKVVHGVHYVPTRARYFRAILRGLSLLRNSVFVDYGAGKGRSLLLAARSGRFRKVVGVEFSADLCRAAQQNIGLSQSHRDSGVSFEVVHGDAADYDVQPDQNVFFMFNPFGHTVMREVIQQVARSLEDAPRRIWVIYLDVKEECFALLAEGGYKETSRIRYGNADVSIFVNDTGRTDLAAAVGR